MSVSRRGASRVGSVLLLSPLLIGNVSQAAAQPSSTAASSEAPDFLALLPIPLAKLALPDHASAAVVATIIAARAGPIIYLPPQPAFAGQMRLGPWNDGSRPLGEIYPVRYGAGAVTLVSKLMRGPWRPYLGAGLSYRFEKHTTPLRNYKVEDSFGPVFQAGLELEMPHYGRLFADAKKGFFKSSVIGEVRGMRSTTVSRYDPVILTAGTAVRF